MDNFIADNAGVAPTTATTTADFGQNSDLSAQIAVMQKRINDKDTHISNIENENKNMRETLLAKEEEIASLKQALEAFKTPQRTTDQNTAIDADTLVGKVMETLTQKQREEVYNNNFATVQDRLVKEYGDISKVNDKVAQISKETGLSVEDLVNTARKSPEAFYKLSGLTQAKPAPTTPATFVRASEASTGADTGNKDLSYYMNLRKTNPKEYWKPDTQKAFRKLFE